MVEVKVEPYSHTLKYYCIKYRYSWKYLNFLNPYRTLVEVWDGACLDYEQPVLFDNFNEAIKFAKYVKKNPNYIKEHYRKQDKIFKDELKRRKQNRNNRNKSLKL